MVAVPYACTMLLFVHSSRLTTAAHAIFLQSSAPLIILPAGMLLLGERASRRELLALPLFALGLVLLLLGGAEPSQVARNPELGNLVGLGLGVAWGGTILAIRWRASRMGVDGAQGTGTAGIAGVTLGNLLACAACLPFALPLHLEAGPGDGGSQAVLTLLYLGVIQIGVAYLCLGRGLGRVRAFEASLLLLIEPVLSPVWAAIFHGEIPPPTAILGGLIILMACTGLALGWNLPPPKSVQKGT